MRDERGSFLSPDAPVTKNRVHSVLLAEAAVLRSQTSTPKFHRTCTLLLPPNSENSNSDLATKSTEQINLMLVRNL